MARKIKSIFCPKVDSEVQSYVDIDAIKNIYYISFIIMIFELLTLLILGVMLLGQPFHGFWISLGSILFCAVVCLFGHLTAKAMLKRPSMSHGSVTAFKIIYCLVLFIWAVWNSARQYNRSEQLLTFFAFELLIVCFIPFKPWISTLFSFGVYSGLYVTLYCIDGAAGLNTVNYIILVLVSIVGKIVNYRSQIITAEKNVKLQQSNEMLEHMNRHDGLTGLRNRRALDEDAPGMVGRAVTAFMIDINYFKMINDTHGHTIGDAVLRETSRKIEELFWGCCCYRYGGDEFLVLSTGGQVYGEDTFTLPVAAIPENDILVSIGRAEGTPEDLSQVFALIAKADLSLYEVKRRTHSPEYSGFERRGSQQRI